MEKDNDIYRETGRGKRTKQGCFKPQLPGGVVGELNFRDSDKKKIFFHAFFFPMGFISKNEKPKTEIQKQTLLR